MSAHPPFECVARVHLRRTDSTHLRQRRCGDGLGRKLGKQVVDAGAQVGFNHGPCVGRAEVFDFVLQAGQLVHDVGRQDVGAAFCMGWEGRKAASEQKW